MEDVFVYDAGQQPAIEGLEELRKDPTNVRLLENYPRAAAYITAEKWDNASDWKKSAIGRQAMQRILAGEDPTMVLDQMHKALLAWELAQEG